MLHNSDSRVNVDANTLLIAEYAVNEVNQVNHKQLEGNMYERPTSDGHENRDSSIYRSRRHEA